MSGHLTLAWPDLGARHLNSRHLRAACRCAGCEQGRRHGHPPAIAADLRVSGMTPIGELGLQLHFSDGHERGIFPWPYLRELALRAESEPA